MTKDEALKLALKALEADELDMVDDGSGNMVFRKEQAIAAIKKALAQEQEPVAWEQFHEHMAGPFYKAPPQPEQEPVAWGVFDDNLHDMFFAKEEAQEMVRLKGDGSTVKPLYTTPPQRKSLTDEEIWKFWWSRPEDPESEDDSMEAEFVAAVRAVLAAHGIKEKNT